MPSSTFILTDPKGCGGASPQPAGGSAWRTAVNGGTVTLSLYKDGSLGGHTSEIILSIAMSTAEAAALGSALGGSGGAASATTGP